MTIAFHIFIIIWGFHNLLVALVSLFGFGGSHCDGVRVTSISIRVTSMGIRVSGMGIGVSAISGPVVVVSTVVSVSVVSGVPVVVVLRVSSIRNNGSSDGSSGSHGGGDFAVAVGIKYLLEFSLGCGNFGFVGEVGGSNGGGGQSGVFTGLGFSESSHKGFFGSGHLSGVLNGVSGGEEGNENL